MTVPHYGKREPGALTAAAPGDTLYFNFASYNDSGDSEALTGLATTDIEVFKNGNATTRATDSGYSLISDTGQIGDRVGLYRFSLQIFNTADDTGHYESGAWYQVAVDSVAIDGKTVRMWVGSFEIGRQRVDVRELGGDTGAANYLKNTYLNGFSDTGVSNRFDRIQSEVDTGLRVHIDDLDTGLHNILSKADTGAIATAVWAGDTGLRDHIDNSDTGVKDAIADLDTGLRDYINDADTGLRAFIDNVDTGLHSVIANQDTGFTANAVWNALRADHAAAGSFGQYVLGDVQLIDGDTGAATHLQQAAAANQHLLADVRRLNNDTGAGAHIGTIFADGFNDTGINDHLGRIRADTDTGLRAQLSDVDTGLHDALADLDTGLRDYINDTDTGLRAHIDDLDTGIKNRFDKLAEDTGGVNVNAIFGDTGAANQLRAAFANGFNDTGITNRFDRIQSEVDTGLRVHIDDLDTGLHDAIADLDTGLRDYIDNTDTGLRAHIDDLDTGIKNRFDAMSEDTGGVNINAIAGDTGAASRLQQFAGTKLSSTGMLDTGTLAGTKAGTIDANVTAVNETSVQGTGANGDEWRPV